MLNVTHGEGILRGLAESLARDAGVEVVVDAPLAQRCRMRVGGTADMLVVPQTHAQAARVWRLAHEHGIAVLPMGLGSNLLVRDGGFRGLVVNLSRSQDSPFGQILLTKHTIRGESGKPVEVPCIKVGAAVPDASVAVAAAQHGLAGLEFFLGIPGAIGGAVAMNAGCYGVETFDRLIDITIITRDGEVERITPTDVGYRYRSGGLHPDWLVVGATFALTVSDEQKVRTAMAAIRTQRQKSQPVTAKTCGSTFRNPSGHSAWRLIDQAGCRGLRLGGAVMSTMHCNFLINDRDATSLELETLGLEVVRRVRASSGIVLEWEVIRVGLPGGARVAQTCPRNNLNV